METGFLVPDASPYFLRTFRQAGEPGSRSTSQPLPEASWDRDVLHKSVDCSTYDAQADSNCPYTQSRSFKVVARKTLSPPRPRKKSVTMLDPIRTEDEPKHTTKKKRKKKRGKGKLTSSASASKRFDNAMAHRPVYGAKVWGNRLAPMDKAVRSSKTRQWSSHSTANRVIAVTINGMNAPLCRMGYTPGDTLATLRSKVAEMDGMPADFAFSLKQGISKENAVFARSAEEWVSLDDMVEVVLMLPHSASTTAPRKSAERGLLTSTTAPQLSSNLRLGSSNLSLNNKRPPLPKKQPGSPTIPWDDRSSASKYTKEGAASVIVQEVRASNQQGDLDFQAQQRSMERDMYGPAPEQDTGYPPKALPLHELTDAADALNEGNEADLRWPYSKPLAVTSPKGSPTVPSIGEALEERRVKEEKAEVKRAQEQRSREARAEEELEREEANASDEYLPRVVQKQPQQARRRGQTKREQEQATVRNEKQRHKEGGNAAEQYEYVGGYSVGESSSAQHFDASVITAERRLLLESADDLLDVFCESQVQSAYAISLVELEEEEEERERRGGGRTRSEADAQAQADELWQQEKLYYENRLETLCASAVYAAVRGAAGVEA